MAGGAGVARHQTERVILQGALGPLPWPNRRTRFGARLAFTSATEGITWTVMGAMMRTAPDLGLRMLLGALSTLPARQVVTALSAKDRATLIDLFSRMRSGRGFLNDLAATPHSAGKVTQPTLVIASRNDGAVPFAHTGALASTIQHSSLIESDADSHFICFSPRLAGDQPEDPRLPHQLSLSRVSGLMGIGQCLILDVRTQPLPAVDLRQRMQGRRRVWSGKVLP